MGNKLDRVAVLVRSLGRESRNTVEAYMLYSVMIRWRIAVLHGG